MKIIKMQDQKTNTHFTATNTFVGSNKDLAFIRKHLNEVSIVHELIKYNNRVSLRCLAGKNFSGVLKLWDDPILIKLNKQTAKNGIDGVDVILTGKEARRLQDDFGSQRCTEFAISTLTQSSSKKVALEVKKESVDKFWQMVVDWVNKNKSTEHTFDAAKVVKELKNKTFDYNQLV